MALTCIPVPNTLLPGLTITLDMGVFGVRTSIPESSLRPESCFERVMLVGLFAAGLVTSCEGNAGIPEMGAKRGVMGDTWSEEELLDLEGPEPQLFCGEVMNP